MIQFGILRLVSFPSVRLGLWLLAYFLAYQGEIRVESAPLIAAILYGVAIGLGALAAFSNRESQKSFSFPCPDPLIRKRYLGLLPALLLSGYLFYDEWTAPITGAVSVRLWLLSLAGMIAPFVFPHSLTNHFQLLTHKIQAWTWANCAEWFCKIAPFILLITIAAAFRAVYLERFPVTIHNDDANCGLAARYILDEWHDGAVRWFRPSDFLRFHTLGFVPSALFQAWFPPNLNGHRLANVALSMVALVCFYLLLRDLFGYATARIGLGLAACAHTAVHWSRSGIHSGHATFLTAICAWFLWKGLQTGRTVWFVWLGFALGCCLITYQAAFLIPVWLSVVIALFWLKNNEFRQRYTLPLIITGLAVFAFMAPTLATYCKAPVLFFTRENSMIFSREEGTVQHLTSLYGENYFPALLWYNLKRSLLLFSQYGDTNFQYGYRLGGMVDDFTAPALVLGLIVAIANGNQWNIWPFLLGIGLCWSIGAGLTLDSTQYSRVAGMAFLLFTLPALWGRELIRTTREIWGTYGERIAGTAMTAALIFVGWINFQLYFVDFDRDQDSTTGLLVSTIAQDARDDGPENTTYILENTDLPTNFRHQTLLFVAAYRQFKSFNDAETVELAIARSQKTVTFLVPTNRNYDLQILRRRFPFGKLETRTLSFHDPVPLYNRYVVSWAGNTIQTKRIPPPGGRG